MNNRAGRAVVVGLTILLAMCAGAYANRATSMAPATPPAQPRVATVDLQKIIDGLDERKAKAAELSAAEEAVEKKQNDAFAELKAEKTKLDSEPDTLAKLAAIRVWRDKGDQLEFEDKKQKRTLNESSADIMRSLNSRINDAIGRIAQREGYHLVLSTDQNIPVTGANFQEVSRAMAIKRMLYVDPSLDITEDVVRQLNNEYAATGGKPAATTKP